MLQEVEGCPAKTATSAISTISQKIATKWEKWQFLPKLIKSTGGRRVSNKNCNFSKNCEKLEKLQFLLKLSTTSVRNKGAQQKLRFLQFLQKIAKKLEKSQFLLKLIKSSVTGGRRVPSKNWDFYNFRDFSKKLWNIRNNCNDPW